MLSLSGFGSASAVDTFFVSPNEALPTHSVQGFVAAVALPNTFLQDEDRRNRRFYHREPLNSGDGVLRVTTGFSILKQGTSNAFVCDAELGLDGVRPIGWFGLARRWY